MDLVCSQAIFLATHGLAAALRRERDSHRRTRWKESNPVAFISKVIFHLTLPIMKLQFEKNPPKKPSSKLTRETSIADVSPPYPRQTRERSSSLSVLKKLP